MVITADEVEASFNPLFGWADHLYNCRVCLESDVHIHCALGLQMRVALYRVKGLNIPVSWCVKAQVP